MIGECVSDYQERTSEEKKDPSNSILKRKRHKIHFAERRTKSSKVIEKDFYINQKSCNTSPCLDSLYSYSLTNGNENFPNKYCKLFKSDSFLHTSYKSKYFEHRSLCDSYNVSCNYLSDKAKNTGSSSSSDSQRPETVNLDSNVDELPLPTPPDGGYGWIIVIAAFFIHMITDGISVSFGVILEDLLTRFKTSVSSASWIGAFIYGFPALLAPLSTNMITKFGCRLTCIIGGIVSGMGCIFAFMTKSIWVLVFSFGFLCGIGMSLSVTSALIIVSVYFDEHRATATGISIAGTGVGALVIVPIIEKLLNYITINEVMLIFAALYLQCCICGVLMRPVESSLDKRKRRRLFLLEKLALRYGLPDMRMNEGYLKCSTEERITTLINQMISPNFNELKPNLSPEHNPSALNNNYINYSKFCNKTSQRYYSVPNVAVQRENFNSALSKRPFRHSDPELYLRSLRTNMNKRITRDSLLHFHPNVRDTFVIMRTRSCASMPEIIPSNRKLNFSKCTIASDESNYTLFCQHKLAGFCCLGKSDRKSLDSSDYSDLKKHENKYGSVKKLIDFSVLKNIPYLIFLISTSILFFWYNVTYFFLHHYAKTQGVPNELSVYLLSIIGVTNTIGDFIIGWIADINVVSTLGLYTICILICGLATALVPALKSFATLSIYSCE